MDDVFDGGPPRHKHFGVNEPPQMQFRGSSLNAGMIPLRMCDSCIQGMRSRRRLHLVAS